MVMLLQQIVVLFALGFINFCIFSATAFVPTILTANSNKYSMHNNMSDKSSTVVPKRQTQLFHQHHALILPVNFPET